MNKKWYGKTTMSDQGLVCEEETGRSVAVTYDAKDVQLVAMSPELLEFAKDVLRYLKAGAIVTLEDRKFVAGKAAELIYKAEH